jgi:hypothetical protein
METGLRTKDQIVHLGGYGSITVATHQARFLPSVCNFWLAEVY